MKNKLKKRFEKLYPTKRLLAIQLNGFTHTIYCDGGSRETEIERLYFSNYAPEDKTLIPLGEMFYDYPNSNYQGNAKELLYIHPNLR